MSALVPGLGTALLAALACGVGYLAITQQIVPPKIIATSAVEVTSQGETAADVADLVPRRREEIYYAAITDRPLFAQSRRPVAFEAEPSAPVELDPDVTPEPQPETVEEIPEPDALLLGVLAGGASNSALISLAGEEPQWVRLGVEIAGWTLSAINPDHVELRETDRLFRLDLYRK